MTVELRIVALEGGEVVKTFDVEGWPETKITRLFNALQQKVDLDRFDIEEKEAEL